MRDKMLCLNTGWASDLLFAIRGITLHGYHAQYTGGCASLEG